MRCETYAYLKGPMHKPKFHIMSFRGCESFYSVPCLQAVSQILVNIFIVF